VLWGGDESTATQQAPGRALAAARVGAAALFAPPLLPPVETPHPALHPGVWRANQMGGAAGAVLPSGFAELDAVLPGGGWPTQVLTELLLPHAGMGELRLLAPVLATLQGQQRCLMWFDPPAAPCAWALAALGIDTRQLVLVHSRVLLKGRAREKLPAADILWALEHALKSGHVGAVLAWLPARLPADALRRLQLAAQAHEGPAFLLRDVQLRSQASPAPLRLLLGSAGPDVLRLNIFKRRGPPLAQPLNLVLPAVLSAPALARAMAGREAPVLSTFSPALQSAVEGFSSNALSPSFSQTFSQTERGLG
jgi:protein ImuA